MRVALPMFELLQPFDVVGDHRSGRELVWIAMIQGRRRGPATSSPGSAELGQAITQGGRASVVATRCQTVRATPAPTPRVPRWDRLLRSLSIRRSAAATRPRARSRSATVYCRGSGRVRSLRGPFADLLARMAALSCFPVAIVASPIILADPANQTYSERLREPSRANLGDAWT